MILMNTTFHVENELVDSFLGWLRERYLPAAGTTPGITSPVVSRLLIEVAPEATSFAVQLSADRLETASAWHDAEGARLRGELLSKWPERIVFFTTYMEVLPL